MFFKIYVFFKIDLTIEITKFISAAFLLLNISRIMYESCVSRLSGLLPANDILRNFV